MVPFPHGRLSYPLARETPGKQHCTRNHRKTTTNTRCPLSVSYTRTNAPKFAPLHETTKRMKRSLLCIQSVKSFRESKWIETGQTTGSWFVAENRSKYVQQGSTQKDWSDRAGLPQNSGKSKLIRLSKWGLKVLARKCPELPIFVIICSESSVCKRAQKATQVHNCRQLCANCREWP